LLHLVREVVELGLGIARIVHFLGAVEFREYVSGLHAHSVGDDLGERNAAALAPDLRGLHRKVVDCLDGSGQTHFMARGGLAGGFDGRLRVAARRVHDIRHGGRAASTGCGKGEQRTRQHRFAGQLHGASFRKLVRRSNRAKCL
jgi:hypothetical protein